MTGSTLERPNGGEAIRERVAAGRVAAKHVWGMLLLRPGKQPVVQRVTTPRLVFSQIGRAHV